MIRLPLAATAWFLLTLGAWAGFAEAPASPPPHSALPSCTEPEFALPVGIRSYSGTPPLLELTIPDPAGAVRAVRLDSPVSSLALQVAPPTGGRGSIEVKITPFVQPGVYDLNLTLETDAGACARRLRVGFVDFVWGRDNFRFANDGERPGAPIAYSELLFRWLEDRFGPPEPRTQVVLLHYMYYLFRNTVGRCYSFAGSQARFRQHPELLPSFYPTIYSIREGFAPIQKEMDFLQFDIVCRRFAAEGHDPDEPQDRESLLGEIQRILRSVEAGSLAATGYLGVERHHSMVIYGFIEDKELDTVTLVAANNWKREQEDNLFSRDAVNILVHLDEGRQEPRIEWLDREGGVFRSPEKLFVIEVEKQYNHDPRTIELLVGGRIGRLRSEGKGILVVESAREAYLRDEQGRETGYKDGKAVEAGKAIDGTVFARVDDHYAFEFPAGASLTLSFSGYAPEDGEDRPPTSLFFMVPDPKAEGQSTVRIHRNIELGDAERREALLRDGELHPGW